jgi:hypothetical protein
MTFGSFVFSRRERPWRQAPRFFGVSISHHRDGDHVYLAGNRPERPLRHHLSEFEVLILESTNGGGVLTMITPPSGDSVPRLVCARTRQPIHSVAQTVRTVRWGDMWTCTSERAGSRFSAIQDQRWSSCRCAKAMRYAVASVRVGGPENKSSNR